MANDKPTTGGTGFIPEASSPEAIKNMANFFGTYFLKGLGILGLLMTAPLTQQDPISSAHKTRELINQERAILNEAERQAGTAMSYLSPLNYGVALATGNGLDPIAGEEEIATWEPYQQALARGAELYTIPKVTRGISKGASKASSKLVRKRQAPLIEPEPNPKHFRFVGDYSDYWSPIDYADESTPFSYTFKARNKDFRNNKVKPVQGAIFKSLMKGSPIEAAVDKNGYISVKTLRDYFGEHKKPGSGRSALERFVVNKVLDSNPFFRNSSKIDFNAFKENVLRELFFISPRLLSHSYVTPKLSKINYNPFDRKNAPDLYKSILRARYPDRFKLVKEPLKFSTVKEPLKFLTIDVQDGTVLTPETFPKYEHLFDHYVDGYETTLESPNIPVTKVNQFGTLGTLGTNENFVVSTEPDILYVRDIDSDWATLSKKAPTFNNPEARVNYFLNRFRAARIAKGLYLAMDEGDISTMLTLVRELRNLGARVPLPQFGRYMPYLKRTFFRRQVQAALDNAFHMGRKKVRFPTEETFVKSGETWYTRNPELDKLSELTKLAAINRQIAWDTYGWNSPECKAAAAIADRAHRNYMEAPIQVFTEGTELKLSRFRKIKKILEELLPDLEVRLVTDSRGNTWYEVDVPNNYNELETMYKKGGKINGKL